jgi:hypothetical protein
MNKKNKKKRKEKKSLARATPRARLDNFCCFVGCSSRGTIRVFAMDGRTRCQPKVRDDAMHRFAF